MNQLTELLGRIQAGDSEARDISRSGGRSAIITGSRK
jgi:hypothetical protein